MVIDIDMRMMSTIARNSFDNVLSQDGMHFDIVIINAMTIFSKLIIKRELTS